MLVDFKRIRSILIIVTLSKLIFAQDFSIARIHYDGGGDWYGDPSSIPNLLNYVQKNTSIAVNLDEARIKLTDSDLYSFSYLYLKPLMLIYHHRATLYLLIERLLQSLYN